jgi:hypothetical protein
MKHSMVAVLVIVLVVALGALGYGVWWRAQYQPIMIVSRTAAIGDRAHEQRLYPGATAISPPLRDVEAAPLDDSEARHVMATYADGQHLTSAYALHNAGSVGITITGFDFPTATDQSLLALIDVRVGAQLTAFRESFTLDAGETRTVVVRQRMHACEYFAPGSSNSWESLSVRYRVLGLNRHADVPTPMRLGVELSKDVKCPRSRLVSVNRP